ncbi:HAD family phosphatase [Robiginitalea sp. SC105]|uniref:HAD family hydrolase n=1 Tax=Robiginitalea sp. SC105 TaxID=2762332 RepID=UPI00163ACEE1|nr:HAD family phosphatase [Robiginitalea sp. SC105]MBC2840781.1 HAD family phosphatase [Robiginitalea sp. SC105]
MVKNLIFDFGDVVIDLNWKAIYGAISAYGISPEHPALRAASREYETGQIDTDTFLLRLSQLFGNTDRETITRHWNSLIGPLPEGRLEFLEQLRDSNRYRMFLLSNTNALHMEFVARELGPAGYNRLKACFEGFYLSYELGLRKPDPEIFEYVLRENRLQPTETLFIDDTLEHTLGAASTGIATWHLQPGKEDVRELLNRI